PRIGRRWGARAAGPARRPDVAPPDGRRHRPGPARTDGDPGAVEGAPAPARSPPTGGWGRTVMT
ncbi:hypothetical protein ACFXPI_39310, partial [Streptomyces sp. NPDC059104]